jgi:aminopeptidase-like protein
MMNLLAYSDGSRDLVAIADKIGVPCWNLFSLIDRLKEERLLTNA